MPLEHFPSDSFELTDGKGQKLYVTSDELSVQFSKEKVLGRVEAAPSISFLVSGWRSNGTKTYVTVTRTLFNSVPALKAIHRFTRERFSLYACGFNHVTFKRNLEFDTDRIGWIHKVPGRYLAYFSEGQFRAFDINKHGALIDVDTTENHLPISHLVPESAWF